MHIIYSYCKQFRCIQAKFLFHLTVSLSAHIRLARRGASSRMHLVKWVSCKIAFTFSCLLLLSTKRRGLIAAVHWLRRRRREGKSKSCTWFCNKNCRRLAELVVGQVGRQTGKWAGGTTLEWGGQLRVAESRLASVDKSLWKWLLPPKELVASVSRHIWLPQMMMRRVAIGTEIDGWMDGFSLPVITTHFHRGKLINQLFSEFPSAHYIRIYLQRGD